MPSRPAKPGTATNGRWPGARGRSRACPPAGQRADGLDLAGLVLVVEFDRAAPSVATLDADLVVRLQIDDVRLAVVADRCGHPRRFEDRDAADRKWLVRLVDQPD